MPYGFPFHWSWATQNSFRNRCSMSGRSGTWILLYCREYRRENFQKSFSADNFWLECPTDLRSTPLSYIFNALFRDTPLGYTFCAQPNSQIAKYPNIWLIWLFGYLAAHDKRGQVGYPWKEHEIYSSEALTWGLWDPPVKSYGQNRFVRLFSLVFYIVSQKK